MKLKIKTDGHLDQVSDENDVQLEKVIAPLHEGTGGKPVKAEVSPRLLFWYAPFADTLLEDVTGCPNLVNPREVISAGGSGDAFLRGNRHLTPLA